MIRTATTNDCCWLILSRYTVCQGHVQLGLSSGLRRPLSLVSMFSGGTMPARVDVIHCACTNRMICVHDVCVLISSLFAVCVYSTKSGAFVPALLEFKTISCIQVRHDICWHASYIVSKSIFLTGKICKI